MDADHITLISVDQDVKVNAEGISNEAAILDDTPSPATPSSKLIRSRGSSFGTFPSENGSIQITNKNPITILDGVVNNGYIPDDDVKPQTIKDTDVNTASSSGAKNNILHELSNSRRSTLDWYQASAGNVNLAYIQDDGVHVRERRSSSTSTKYAALNEEECEVSVPSTESTKPPLLKKFTIRW
jgi:hypothetical protein